MLISIIIPTRDRAEVLKYSLASCARITDRELEIIVSDNSSVDDTPGVVAEFQDSRIRYVRTPQRCSMRQNFEFAVSQARGDYIFMLGDDDALIPNQFPYLRALLERYAPDTLTGSIIGYTWPGPAAPSNSGRLKFEFKSIYGGLTSVTGEELRAELERDGASIARYAPRIYGGIASRNLVEGLKAKAGQLFMATWPDTYFTFASPSLIRQHLIVAHPFFIAGSSPRSNGASYHSWKRDGAWGADHEKFLVETRSDPVLDVIPATASDQLGIRSHLESANRYVYGGQLRIDYAREAERVSRSLDELDRNRRTESANAFARYASERNLPPALCEAHALLGRCAPGVKPPKSARRTRAKVRSYLSFDRVVLDLTGFSRTEVDAAASACENLLGQRVVQGGLQRWLAWGQLLGRALPLIKGSRNIRAEATVPNSAIRRGEELR